MTDDQIDPGRDRTFAEGPADGGDIVSERTFADALPAEPDDEVRAAEAAAQRAACSVPDGPLPDDLALALERRIEVTRDRLASDPTGWPRGGGSDPEVRDLEAPYRRVQKDDAPIDGGR